MRFAPRLLWIDCTAAAVAGVLVLALAGPLAGLYALPRSLLVVMGAANLAFGAYSFTLARRPARPRALVIVLVAANAAWASLCVLGAVLLAGPASPFGVAHLAGEGVFVGALAALEWRYRELLSDPS